MDGRRAQLVEGVEYGDGRDGDDTKVKKEWCEQRHCGAKNPGIFVMCLEKGCDVGETRELRVQTDWPHHSAPSLHMKHYRFCSLEVCCPTGEPLATHGY